MFIRREYRILSFNPCFNGSDSKREPEAAREADTERVSILVLMEVTLKEKSYHGDVSERGCFNPCFNGSDSKRGLRPYSTTAP